MPGKQFEIDIRTLHWIKYKDDPTDLCAHGSIYVRIGGEVIVAEPDGDGWALNAAVLHLMRTLEADYMPGDHKGYLVPCCGHEMYAEDDGNRVSIPGCMNGFKWTIMHTGNFVTHIGDTEECTIDIAEYSAIVLELANKIEEFYNTSLPKQIPDDKIDREGYKAFWKEWHNIRARWR
jgi:hypothetical protein